MEPWIKPECQYSYLVIEGNIGAGKTSLVKRLAEDYGAKPVYERFEQNPFLEKFYQQPERYALSLEMSFLADRYDQLKKEVQTRDMFYPFMVADYYLMKSLIFSRNTLAEDEYRLYSHIFNIIHASLPKPDFYVFLHQEVKQLMWNIQTRGRDYEKAITHEYLESIQEGYFHFFRQQTGIRILILDTREVDFVHHEEDYRRLLDTLFRREYPEGVTRCSLRPL